MKDLRDLMSMIDESQYAFDDTHNYFDGVWDSYKKIHNLSVPDAVMAPSVETIRAEHRRRAISSNKLAEKFNKSKEDDTVLMNQGENGGNGGGAQGGPGRPSGDNPPTP